MLRRKRRLAKRRRALLSRLAHFSTIMKRVWAPAIAIGIANSFPLAVVFDDEEHRADNRPWTAPARNLSAYYI